MGESKYSNELNSVSILFRKKRMERKNGKARSPNLK